MNFQTLTRIMLGRCGGVRIASRGGVRFAIWSVLAGVAAMAAMGTPASAQYPQYPTSPDAARDSSRRAAVAAARAEVDRAQSLMTAATQRVKANWQAHPEVQASSKAVADARRTFESARAKIVQKLRTDPNYLQAEREDTAARAAVLAEQQRTNATQPASTQPANAPEPGPNLPAPSPGQVEAAAEKLQRKTRLRELEDTAIAGDPDASAAQAKLNLAEQDAKALQAQFDAALQNDNDYRAAQQAIAAARARVTAAAAGN